MKNRRYKSLAKSLLGDLGNSNPSNNHLTMMEHMLGSITTICRWKYCSSLSAREADCLLLVAHGKTPSEIGKILKIKKPTLDTHLREILRKLKCKTMAHAVYRIMRYSLL